MALKMNFTVTDNFGQPYTVEDAYLQMYEVSGTKAGVTAKFFVKKPDQINVVDRLSFEFVPSVADGAPNFIRQAYLHMKTLPEFAGAVDC